MTARPTQLSRPAAAVLALVAMAAWAQPEVPAAAAAASAPAEPVASAAASASAPARKDIVLDTAPPAVVTPAPAPAASEPVARLVPRPTEAASASSAPPAPPVPTRITTEVHRAALAGHAAELGLDLLRSQAGAGNAVVSPASVSIALGMVQAGVAAADGREISQLFGGARAGRTMIESHLPAALDRAVAQPKDGTAPALTLASRLWVHQASAPQLQPRFVQTLQTRYQASAALLDFGKTDAARQTINSWVGEHTRGLIPDLLSPGSLGADARMVLTQATHFRSPWAQPFRASETRNEPFETSPGQRKPVPTLHGLMSVRAGAADGFDVYELPFQRGDIVAQIAVPAVGTPLTKALEQLDGLDVAAWSAGLKPTRCLMQLPKLALKPAAQSLKTALQGLGVQRVFSDAASFEPALGPEGAHLRLSDVIHAASLTLDEQGGEAAAATAATVVAKSLDMTPTRACVVDRPFLLVLMHKPTQLPLFVARVTDPSKP